MSTKPIRPDEVSALRAATIPDFVIEAFNELIAANFSGNQAVVRQCEAVDVILAKSRWRVEPGLKREDVYSLHYLDVEHLYRAEGWEVEYDKPGFNENYEPKFFFRKRP